MTPRPASDGPVRRVGSSTKLRRELVEQLSSNRSLKSAPVRAAFRAVPREQFIPEIAQREGLERVYEDQAIVTAKDERGVPTSSSSQPSMMAAMLEALELRRGQRVLEIGAGTGYNAALLAHLVGARGHVVSVELDPATARRARRALAGVKSRARVVSGDGRDGWQRGAPYNRIIVTASTATVPLAWLEQLADGGLLELPLRLLGQDGQAIVTLRKHGDTLRSEQLLPGGFMPLRDAPGAPVPAPPPSLSATERINARSRPLAVLSGAALGHLSAAQRQRLLALALSEPRAHKLGIRASRAALALYLMIEAPADRLVTGWPRLGVVSQNGDGLALLNGGPKTLTRIESYGERDAERLLLGLVDAWKQRGRPSLNDLRIDVSFEAKTSSVRLHWHP